MRGGRKHVKCTFLDISLLTKVFRKKKKKRNFSCKIQNVFLHTFYDEYFFFNELWVNLYKLNIGFTPIRNKKDTILQHFDANLNSRK